ncbi:MAG TPA: hypothetical protein VNA89_06895 [Gemmatimonadaceae bacterium]|nr:hypothetical protein [Gemmatimonadaceae bacterium]
MTISVQLEPADGAPPAVEYRWDPDTDILTAQLRAARAEGTSGSVELEGTDGSWLVLDVSAGCIHGVEVAVWPDVRKVPTLSPPAEVEFATVRVPGRRSQPGPSALEVNTALFAEADQAERTIHFRLGQTRQTRTVGLARDLLLDLDSQQRIAGVWLLNVPPFPDT